MNVEKELIHALDRLERVEREYVVTLFQLRAHTLGVREDADFLRRLEEGRTDPNVVGMVRDAIVKGADGTDTCVLCGAVTLTRSAPEAGLPVCWWGCPP